MHRQSLVAVLSFALLLSGACDNTRDSLAPEASTGEPQLVVASSGGTETLLTTSSSYEQLPAIDGDRVVWIGDANGDWDVYLYDLSTHVTTRITSTPDVSEVYPAVSGKWIVWQVFDLVGCTKQFPTCLATIIAYDLTLGRTVPITTTAVNSDRPALSGGRVAWHDGRRGASDIYVYDLSTGTESLLTSTTSSQAGPAISGDRMVWTEFNASGDIYFYDLLTKSGRWLTADVAHQDNPSISGDRVVWSDRRDGTPQVYAYDLITGTESRITFNTTGAYSPVISGNRIAWADARNPGPEGTNQDIYSFDLATRTETQITDDLATQAEPAISGDRIVWFDLRNGNGDIYLYEFSAAVVPSIQLILGRVEEYLRSGGIKNEGIAQSLRALLAQAAAAIDSGNAQAARNTLGALIHHLTAQSGKGVDPAAAQVLIQMAQQIITGL